MALILGVTDNILSGNQRRFSFQIWNESGTTLAQNFSRLCVWNHWRSISAVWNVLNAYRTHCFGWKQTFLWLKLSSRRVPDGSRSFQIPMLVPDRRAAVVYNYSSMQRSSDVSSNPRAVPHAVTPCSDPDGSRSFQMVPDCIPDE